MRPLLLPRSPLHRLPFSMALSCAAGGICVQASGEVVTAAWITPRGGTWTEASNWSGGVVPMNDARTTFDVVIGTPRASTPSVVLATPATIDTMTIGVGAHLVVDAPGSLAIAGSSVTNEGTIALGTTVTTAFMAFAGAESTLDGNGQVVGGTLGSQVRALADGATLINAKGHTIRGNLTVGAKITRLVNFGLIRADEYGGTSMNPEPIGLRVNPRYPDVNVNAGVMRAAEGGVLQMFGGIYDNSNGVIEAEPGGEIHFGAVGSTSYGIPLTVVSGGVLRAKTGSPNGKIEIYDTLRLQDGATVEGEIIAGGDLPQMGLGRELLIGVGASVPKKIRIGGYAAGTFPGRLSTELHELSIGGCTINGNPLVSGTNLIQGLSPNLCHCTIERDSILTGRLRLQFNDGVDHHGLIECGPGEAVGFGGTPKPFRNHSDGIMRFIGSAGPSPSGWNSPFDNRGLVQVGTERIIETKSIHQNDGVFEHHGSVIMSNPNDRLFVNGGRVIGSGTFGAGVIHAGGVISPHAIDGSPAVLTVVGAYIQAAAGTLEIDVAGSTRGGESGDRSASAGDRLAISSAATLAGSLRVCELPGAAPALGESFTIITAASIAGTFGAVDSCRPVCLAYTPTSVIVTFTTDAADLDADGFVDGADLTVALGAWGECADECCAADLNGDGLVDGADLTVILGAWSSP